MIARPLRWSMWWRVLVGTAMLVAGPRAAAQHGSAPVGEVIGVVFDSLDRKPLGNASVFLVGTQLSATTNAQGRFVFDSVPAGAYRVAFESADLDAIGLAPNPRTVEVRNGVVDTIALFVPSVSSLLDAMCPAAREAGGQSILVGSVRDAATDVPVAAASVTLSWADITVKNKHLVEWSGSVPVASASDGSYAVCGVPGDAVLTVHARADQRSSGHLAVYVPAQRLVRQDVFIALGADSTATSVAMHSASLEGVVTDTGGHPLAGADLQLTGMPVAARTDEQGRFRLSSLPAGSWDVEIHRLGFLPFQAAVVLHPHRTTTASFALSTPTHVLDTVRVRSQRPNAFALQQKSREYPGATFFDSAAIDSLHASKVTDILRGARGVQLVVPDSGGPPLVQMARSRFSDLGHAGLCPVEYYVDGVPFDMQNSPDAYFQPGDIVAIEVYDGAANVPPEYKAGSSQCGVIVIWTKRAGP